MYWMCSFMLGWCNKIPWECQCEYILSTYWLSMHCTTMADTQQTHLCWHWWFVAPFRQLHVHAAEPADTTASASPSPSPLDTKTGQSFSLKQDSQAQDRTFDWQTDHLLRNSSPPLHPPLHHGNSENKAQRGKNVDALYVQNSLAIIFFYIICI